jgi:DNA-directed RNA polymerase specialized sigma24 family protein
MLYVHVMFDRFVESEGVRLRAGLVAAYGPEVGLDAASEAMAYGWEHWDRLSSMTNPAGYLYRVGQTSARRSRRRGPMMPVPPVDETHDVEPRLPEALAQLSESQRSCVMLVHAFGWPQTEVADLLGMSVSSVRTHLARGLAKLQSSLEVGSDVH